MSETVELAAPASKIRVPRLEEWMKAYPVNNERGRIMPKAQAQAFLVYGRRRGWKMVSQCTQAGEVVVWRVA